jgi:polar amino acid transport system substrate-binding protein
MTKYHLLLAFSLLLSFSNGQASPQEITVGAGGYCPWMCKDTEQPGILVEIIKMALEEEGFSIKLVSPPWTRMMSETATGKIDVLPIASAKNTRDFVWYTDSPVFVDRLCFYGTSSVQWQYEGIESLKSIRTGLVNNYGYPPAIMKIRKDPAYQVMRINDSGDPTIARLIRMAASHRFDATPGAKSVADHMIRELKLTQAVTNKGCESEGIPEYIGVSKRSKHAKQLLQSLNRKIAELKNNGELTKLFLYYGYNP